MYKLEKQENDMMKVTLSFTKEEWDGFVNEAYEKTKEKFNVQGFRKGKAPKKVIEQNYGPNVFFDEAIDMAFQSEYRKVFENEKDFDPISAPDVSIDKFDDNGLILVAKVQNVPTVKLGAYTGMTVKKATGKVTNEQIEKELEQARERLARFVEVERPAEMGDIATIDFSGSIDGKVFEGGTASDYRLELGSHSFIDNFEEQICGLKLGESKDVKVNFPADYQVEELKGKPAVFAVTLKKLEKKELPELNDEFASNASEFDTLDEYKADIKKHLEESLQTKLDRDDENTLIEEICKTSEVAIPEVLVERQLDMFIRDFEMRLSYQGLSLEDYAKYTNTDVKSLKESRREQAKETVKTRLVLEELIKQEKLACTKEEIDAKLAEVAAKYKKSVEDYKKSMNEKQLAYFENDILMDKLVKFLKEHNTLA